MNFKLLPHLGYLTVHGSRAYGLATESSDLDIKGICVPPHEVTADLFHTFDQAVNPPEVLPFVAHLVNPLNPKVESSVYSLRKFVKLAAEVNPNVIELLFTEPEDRLLLHPALQPLFDNRELFLSRRARHTFTGYASAQLAKIDRHRKWLTHPPLKGPKRHEFGLPLQASRFMPEVRAALLKTIDGWLLGVKGLDDPTREELQERCFSAVTHVSGVPLDWGNWVQLYEQAAIIKLGVDLGLSATVMNLIQQENAFHKAKQNHDKYLLWQTTRNPERQALERAHGFDTKSAMHLCRLLNCGLEVLATGKLSVRRPDREFLLSVRRGEHTYDWLLDFTGESQEKIIALQFSSPLPKQVDQEKINRLYHDVTARFLSCPR